MGFFTRLLDTLINPNLLSLLFLAGIGGIVFEVFHPGVVLPGALGAVSLLTALFGFSVLPTSWAAVALIGLGLGLLVIDAHVVTHGALTVSGLVALAVGMLMLFHDAPPQYQVNTWFVLGDHRDDRRLHGVRARQGRGGATPSLGHAGDGGRRGRGTRRRPRLRARRALAGGDGRRRAARAGSARACRRRSRGSGSRFTGYRVSAWPRL